MSEKMRMLKVTWLDHASFLEQVWRDSNEYEDLIPTKVVSVGHLLKETQDYIILVLCHQESSEEYEDRYSGEIMILKNCIIERKALKEV